jgi:hypothetical protein
MLVTFRDLQKLVQGEAAQFSLTENLQTKLRGKAFWIWLDKLGIYPGYHEVTF